ncbi:MAG: cellulase family glycosylhydrolase [Phycisphaerae bacterium]|jgi:hypothetical protein|nr:cellulase family glycosylhydrolase [Phycisphaerae bacterium]
MKRLVALAIVVVVSLLASAAAGADDGLERIVVTDDGTHFAGAESGKKFTAWGFNYTHNRSGKLMEDFWTDDWETLAGDFREMKALGANVVRIHLQTTKIMTARDRPDPAALKQLARLVKLAEKTKLYLDVTGLACYKKQRVPKWYSVLGESDRWDVQARFWEAVAKTCAKSNAVFCYDLMNEPILPGKKKAPGWLTGEFSGFTFVQRISLDLAGRTRRQVARAWVDKLAGAIRKHDKKTLVTVGVIPWAYAFFPNAGKPIFYADRVDDKLDFVSVHFYPKKGDVDNALAALKCYDVGKPIVIEETFTLHCGVKDFDAFVDGSRKIADGWIAHYFGSTIEEYEKRKGTLADAIHKAFLVYFKKKTPEILGATKP